MSKQQTAKGLNLWQQGKGFVKLYLGKKWPRKIKRGLRPSVLLFVFGEWLLNIVFLLLLLGVLRYLFPEWVEPVFEEKKKFLVALGLLFFVAWKGIEGISRGLCYQVAFPLLWWFAKKKSLWTANKYLAQDGEGIAQACKEVFEEWGKEGELYKGVDCQEQKEFVNCRRKFHQDVKFFFQLSSEEGEELYCFIESFHEQWREYIPDGLAQGLDSLLQKQKREELAPEKFHETAREIVEEMGKVMMRFWPSPPPKHFPDLQGKMRRMMQTLDRSDIDKGLLREAVREVITVVGEWFSGWYFLLCEEISAGKESEECCFYTLLQRQDVVLLRKWGAAPDKKKIRRKAGESDLALYSRALQEEGCDWQAVEGRLQRRSVKDEEVWHNKEGLGYFYQIFRKGSRVFHEGVLKDAAENKGMRESIKIERGFARKNHSDLVCYWKGMGKLVRSLEMVECFLSVPERQQVAANISRFAKSLKDLQEKFSSANYYSPFYIDYVFDQFKAEARYYHSYRRASYMDTRSIQRLLARLLKEIPEVIHRRMPDYVDPETRSLSQGDFFKDLVKFMVVDKFTDVLYER